MKINDLTINILGTNAPFDPYRKEWFESEPHYDKKKAKALHLLRLAYGLTEAEIAEIVPPEPEPDPEPKPKPSIPDMSPAKRINSSGFLVQV